MTIVMLRRKGLGKTSCSKIELYSQKGIITVRNDAIHEAYSSPDVLIRWGCTSSLKATKTYNKSEAIHRVSNKTGFRKLLMDKDMETVPFTWFWDNELGIPYPLIVRPEVHSQGKHCYLVNNNQEFIDATKKCGHNWYASEYIKKVAEYRITFCQGRVVWVANKIPSNPEDIAWNVAQGGKFENVKWGSWHLPSIHIASRAFNLSGLDFGAVDIMVDSDDRPYVLEINSAPSMTSEYRQRCMALALDHMVSEKEIIPMGMGGHYTDYIHPAVLNGEKNA